MSFLGKLTNPRNIRDFWKIAKVSSELDKHMKKRCGYCDEMEMGFGDEVPVIDFIKHLKEKHPDKVTPDQLKQFEKLVGDRNALSKM